MIGAFHVRQNDESVHSRFSPMPGSWIELGSHRPHCSVRRNGDAEWLVGIGTHNPRHRIVGTKQRQIGAAVRTLEAEATRRRRIMFAEASADSHGPISAMGGSANPDHVTARYCQPEGASPGALSVENIDNRVHAIRRHAMAWVIRVLDGNQRAATPVGRPAPFG